MCLIEYLGTHIFLFILPAIKLPLLERFPGLVATRSSSPSRPLGYFCFRYRKIASSRLSRLVANARIFRLFMKGKFDAYLYNVVTFDQNSSK